MATTARNKQDADNMNVRDRLWDSLNYSYGKKREDSDKSFAKTFSQAVNQGIKTGTQRSSFKEQMLANINKQKLDAQNDIYDQQIADYENRMYQIDRDELEDAWRQKQFDENQRQHNENLAFQKSQADRSQANWEKEFAETLAQNKWNREYAQDEFKYKYGLAGGGSGGSYGGGGGSYTPSTNTPPASTGNPLDMEGLDRDTALPGSIKNPINYSSVKDKKTVEGPKISGMASTVAKSKGITTTPVVKNKGRDNLKK